MYGLSEIIRQNKEAAALAQCRDAYIKPGETADEQACREADYQEAREAADCD